MNSGLPDLPNRSKGDLPGTSTAAPPFRSDRPLGTAPPAVPDHELLRRIGEGSYGEVWLARNKLDTLRAAKVVYRRTFEDARPFEREFRGIQKFEPISRSHDGLVDILQVGGTEEYFYYVMELADDASSPVAADVSPRVTSSTLNAGDSQPAQVTRALTSAATS